MPVRCIEKLLSTCFRSRGINSLQNLLMNPLQKLHIYMLDSFSKKSDMFHYFDISMHELKSSNYCSRDFGTRYIECQLHEVKTGSLNQINDWRRQINPHTSISVRNKIERSPKCNFSLLRDSFYSYTRKHDF